MHLRKAILFFFFFKEQFSQDWWIQYLFILSYGCLRGLMLALAVLKAVITVFLKYCILTLLAAWWKSYVTLAGTVHFYS